MSTLKTNTIKNTDDVEMYLAKAWVNFRGTSTVEITAAGNVSSITDNGTGDYTVNFTTALPDAKYASLFSLGGSSTMFNARTKTGTSNESELNIETQNNSDVLADSPYVYVAVFR